MCNRKLQVGEVVLPEQGYDNSPCYPSGLSDLQQFYGSHDLDYAHLLGEAASALKYDNRPNFRREDWHYATVDERAENLRPWHFIELEVRGGLIAILFPSKSPMWQKDGTDTRSHIVMFRTPGVGDFTMSDVAATYLRALKAVSGIDLVEQKPRELLSA